MSALRSTEVQTRDVDRARTEVGQIFCPHRLLPVSRGSVDLDLRARRIGSVGLVSLDYGAAVRIEPGSLDSFYLVQLPLAGSANIRQGRDEFVSTPSAASVLSPHDDIRMKWDAGTPQSIVYIERCALEQRLARMLDRPLAAPLRFDLAMSTRSGGAKSWLRAVDYLRDEARSDASLVADAHYAAQLASMLMTCLLTGHQHNYSHALARPGVAVTRKVRQACELIEHHHAEPLVVQDIADAVGVSVRALQDGFQRELGTSPMCFLRRARLQATRAALSATDPSCASVTAIALEHGLGHLGRFAVAYRAAFGESPSQTLAR